MTVLRNVFAIIGVAIVLAAFLDYTVRGGKGLRGLYRRTPLGRRGLRYQALGRLAPAAQIEHFTAVLGPPVFRNPGKTYDEFVYIDEDSYGDAIATKEGQVEFYAVTSRTKEFRPRIWGQDVYWSLANNSKGLKLGEFTFADFPMKDDPDGIMGWLGARRFHYAECYYFGNPGLYQTYVLAVNDAGWIDPLTVNVLPIFHGDVLLGSFAGPLGAPSTQLADFLALEEIRTLRRVTKPNTYGVLGPHLGPDQILAMDSLVSSIGPNLDQVRRFPL